MDWAKERGHVDCVALLEGNFADKPKQDEPVLKPKGQPAPGAPGTAAPGTTPNQLGQGLGLGLGTAAAAFGAAPAPKKSKESDAAVAKHGRSSPVVE